ncbi:MULTISPECIES: hypothetical protein [unclassified Nonomuraea]|uniref:hypothetical protein n=1 Tax=unclassified Nonomuraea TaxID=2593643 RepID=UPI0033DB3ECB
MQLRWKVVSQMTMRDRQELAEGERGRRRDRGLDERSIGRGEGGVVAEGAPRGGYRHARQVLFLLVRALRRPDLAAMACLLLARGRFNKTSV